MTPYDANFPASSCRVIHQRGHFYATWTKFERDLIIIERESIFPRLRLRKKKKRKKKIIRRAVDPLYINVFTGGSSDACAPLANDVGFVPEARSVDDGSSLIVWLARVMANTW